MAGIYINQQIVKTTAEWAGDSTVYPANILLFEKLDSGKFSIAVTDGVNTFSNLNKVVTDIDAYSKEESDERYPMKADVVAKIPKEVIDMITRYDNGGTMTDEDYGILESYAPNESNTYICDYGSDVGGSLKIIVVNDGSYIYVQIFFNIYTEYRGQLKVNKNTKETSIFYLYSNIQPGSDGSLNISSNVINGEEATSASIGLQTQGTGSKYLSDDGRYKEIDTSSLAAKEDVYTKTEADNKFALASKQLYIISNPDSILNMETMSDYPIEQIAYCLGVTLESFINNGYYLRCFFPQYIARAQQKTYYDDSDVFHFRVLFTFIESDYVKDITIDQARGSDTCSITVIKKQLVTNIVSMSESNYASLSSKDSSTLYLVY